MCLPHSLNFHRILDCFAVRQGRWFRYKTSLRIQQIVIHILAYNVTIVSIVQRLKSDFYLYKLKKPESHSNISCLTASRVHPQLDTQTAKRMDEQPLPWGQDPENEVDEPMQLLNLPLGQALPMPHWMMSSAENNQY